MIWLATATLAILCAAAGSVWASRAVHGRAGAALRPGWVRPVAALAGGVAGVCAVLATEHAGSWWWLAPMAIWAVGIAAGAVCDAATIRIPARLVWSTAVGTITLLFAAAVGTASWRPLLVAVFAAAAVAVTFGVCWRFFGLGFGDVRFGTLGGLGMGHASAQSVGAAFTVFVVITAIQAVTVYRCTRDRRATFPLGPGLAAAFFTAAVV